VQEWRAGWLLVFSAACGISLTSVHIYSTGLFMEPLEAEFGWTRTQLTSGLTLVSIVGVLLSPVAGVLVDRWNARRVALPGVMLYAGGVMALSLATPSIVTWWLLWFFVAVGALLLKPTVWSAAVSSAFTTTRGLALAVMLCGTGVGAAVVPLAAEALIEHVGWRGAYRALGAGFMVIVFPMLWLFFFDRRAEQAAALEGKPAPTGTAASAATSGWSVREGMRKRQFFQLVLAAVLMTGVIVGCVVHLLPILVDQGLARDEAIGFVAMIGLLSITGRLGAGALFDRLPGPPIGMVSAVLPAVFATLLLLAPDSAAATFAAVIALGLAVGSEYDAVIYLSTRYFGLRNFGSLFGFVSSSILAGVGIGPLMAGMIFDQDGSYERFLLAIVPACLVSGALLVTLGPYPNHE
jgi:MFS family permease